MTSATQNDQINILPVQVPILGRKLNLALEFDSRAVITHIGNETFVNGQSLNKEIVKIFSDGLNKCIVKATNEELVQKCNAVFRLFSRK